MKLKPRGRWPAKKGWNESTDQRDDTNERKDMKRPDNGRLFVDRKRSYIHRDQECRVKIAENSMPCITFSSKENASTDKQCRYREDYVKYPDHLV